MILRNTFGSHIDYENGIVFSSRGQEILNRLEKSGNFTQNTRKVKNFSKFYFFFDFLIELYLLHMYLCLLNSLNKTLEKYLKWNNCWKSRGNLSEKVGTMVFFDSAYGRMDQVPLYLNISAECIITFGFWQNKVLLIDQHADNDKPCNKLQQITLNVIKYCS